MLHDKPFTRIKEASTNGYRYPRCQRAEKTSGIGGAKPFLAPGNVISNQCGIETRRKLGEPACKDLLVAEHPITVPKTCGPDSFR